MVIKTPFDIESIIVLKDILKTLKPSTSGKYNLSNAIKEIINTKKTLNG
jgi:hypothetical protein